jgi:hypothetical protein
MVMQSVPAKRATNRLIRGNRTDVQKRCGSYSLLQDLNQGEQRGFPHREKFRSGNRLEDTCKYRLEIIVGFRFYRRNGQKLVGAVRIASVPRSKREESFSNEFISCFTKVMVSKYRHGSFHNIESPTRKSMLIGSERKKEIEGELFWFEVFYPFFGPQSVVEPRKGSWDFSYEVRNDRHKRFLQRHNRFSKGLLLMRDAHCISRKVENRLNGITVAQKLEKLVSFQLSKLSDLGNSFTQSNQTKMFAEIAETEVGRRNNGKKIQQINKFRREEDSKFPLFVTLY